MPNPFAKEKKPAAADQFEEVGGSFECQHGDCEECVHDAKYFHVAKILVWKCSRGHKSFIEDFRL